ncbi:uncharacterized protein LOC130998425 [Salvia miltiorrhiza]|uniref:uncharacterized protein LOC130998425 n=1 Tax=Salvia miltiorrhiza TaxID=226208 RepID=UPI0025AB83A3|nr:uncharacterized protein LOC130998425 [Salvia miltiorrhiza]
MFDNPGGYTWKLTPPAMKDKFFDELQKEFLWQPADERDVRKMWVKNARKRYSDMMSDYKADLKQCTRQGREMSRPIWMTPDFGLDFGITGILPRLRLFQIEHVPTGCPSPMGRVQRSVGTWAGPSRLHMLDSSESEFYASLSLYALRVSRHAVAAAAAAGPQSPSAV